MVELLATLQPGLPSACAIGKGNALRLAGWCTTARAVRRLELLVNGQAQPVFTWLPQASATHSYDFWTIISVTEPAQQLELGLRAVLTGGEIAQQPLGCLPVETVAAPRSQAPPLSTTPLVAICMATFNPEAQLFRRQIESICAQTWTNWRCIIRDDGSDPAVLEEMRQIIGVDERFELVAASEHCGFYQNFERCLTLAPPAAEFIALADQDDVWQPFKLERSLAQFTPQTWLVYCDLRVVNKMGELLSSTFWRYRQNNYADLGALLLVNSVPGAGTMFRRRLLDYILPFPPPEPTIFHDHWIAVMALSLGAINYVDEPLYDWVQHGANVGGFSERPRPPLDSLLSQLRQTLCAAHGQQAGRGIYHTHILPLALMARVAALRGKGEIAPAKRQVLERAAALDHAWLSLVWLAARGLGDWRQRGVTNGMEYYFLNGALWRQRASWRARAHRLLQSLGAAGSAEEPGL